MFACRMTQSAEKTFFRTLNRVAEPAIRHGFGSPWPAPVGAVVLDTIGRKSGRTYRIPVLASKCGSVLAVSTVRGRSQWIKNVAAEPHIHVWLRGKRQACTAYVMMAGEMRSTSTVRPSPTVQTVLNLLAPMSRLTGGGVAVLHLTHDREILTPAETDRDLPVTAAMVSG